MHHIKAFLLHTHTHERDLLTASAVLCNFKMEIFVLLEGSWSYFVSHIALHAMIDVFIVPIWTWDKGDCY